LECCSKRTDKARSTGSHKKSLKQGENTPPQAQQLFSLKITSNQKMTSITISLLLMKTVDAALEIITLFSSVIMQIFKSCS